MEFRNRHFVIKPLRPRPHHPQPHQNNSITIISIPAGWLLFMDHHMPSVRATCSVQNSMPSRLNEYAVGCFQVCRRVHLFRRESSPRQDACISTLSQTARFSTKCNKTLCNMHSPRRQAKRKSCFGAIPPLPTSDELGTPKSGSGGYNTR